MYYIYRITNNINGKTYIGQHKYKYFSDGYMGSGKILKQAQKKYGVENFTKEILVFNISERKHADLLEKTFIASERKKVGIKNCYNITDGGEGHSGPFSEEHKKKLSEVNKGRTFSEETRKKISEILKGHPVSEETRKKLSESHIGKQAGRDNPFYGKHHSEETRKKLSESHKGKSPSNKGKPMSEEQKKKLSEINKGKTGSCKGKHWKLVDGKRVWY